MNLKGRMVRSVLVGGLGVAAWSGCQADKFTYQNFSRIRQHMDSKGDVEMLLGEPTHQMDDQWIYDPSDEHMLAIIDFDASGRVARKQWVDAEKAHFEDSARDSEEGPSSEQTTIRSRVDD